MPKVFENDDDPLVRRGLSTYLTERWSNKTTMFQSMFDEELHCDFRNEDSIKAKRSAESLKSCVRFALNRNVFCDSSRVVSKNKRNDDDVWRVAFHGTNISNLVSILIDGHLSTWKCARGVFGKGIYLSPDVHTAKHYARHFHFEGHDYQIILQVRVLNRNISRVVQPSEHEQSGLKDYWVMKNDIDVQITDVLLFSRDNFCSDPNCIDLLVLLGVCSAIVLLFMVPLFTVLSVASPTACDII